MHLTSAILFLVVTIPSTIFAAPLEAGDSITELRPRGLDRSKYKWFYGFDTKRPSTKWYYFGKCLVPDGVIDSFTDTKSGSQFADLSDPSDDGPASADINRGFGGKCSYLIPLYSQWDRGLDYIESRHQPNEDPSRADMAKGAGGDYRYIIPHYNTGRKSITDVALFRSKTKHTTPPAGYIDMTSDINEGRGGDYLYVVWKG